MHQLQARHRATVQQETHLLWSRLLSWATSVPVPPAPAWAGSSERLHPREGPSAMHVLRACVGWAPDDCACACAEGGGDCARADAAAHTAPWPSGRGLHGRGSSTELTAATVKLEPPYATGTEQATHNQLHAPRVVCTGTHIPRLASAGLLMATVLGRGHSRRLITASIASFRRGNTKSGGAAGCCIPGRSWLFRGSELVHGQEARATAFEPPVCRYRYPYPLRSAFTL